MLGPGCGALARVLVAACGGLLPAPLWLAIGAVLLSAGAAARLSAGIDDRLAVPPLAGALLALAAPLTALL